MEEKTILQQAQEAVYSDRASDYGTVTANFNIIADFWKIILKQDITAEQVGMCMIAIKMARHMNKFKLDNLVDIAGYAATLEKLNNGE